MQSRIFTKNRPLKVFKIRRIERLFRTSVGILLARGRAFPFGVSVIPPRAPPPRTPHLHMSANALAARPPAPAVGRRAVLPSFRRAARAAAPRAPARSPSTPMSDSTSCSSARSARPSPRPAASETSWPRCPRCVRDFPVSNRIDARPSRADARESASRSVSPQRQKCQLSGRSPDSQHDERHSGRRVEIARFFYARARAAAAASDASLVPPFVPDTHTHERLYS